MCGFFSRARSCVCLCVCYTEHALPIIHTHVCDLSLHVRPRQVFVFATHKKDGQCAIILFLVVKLLALFFLFQLRLNVQNSLNNQALAAGTLTLDLTLFFLALQFYFVVSTVWRSLSKQHCMIPTLIASAHESKGQCSTSIASVVANATKFIHDLQDFGSKYGCRHP